MPAVSLLIWQPVYLTVLAQALGGPIPRLAGCGQSLDGGFTRALRLPGLPHSGGLVQAARDVGDFWEEMLAQWQTVCRLPADCVLDALLYWSEPDLARKQALGQS